MKESPTRALVSVWIVAAILVALNFAGLAWIRRGMIPDPARRPIMQVVSALPRQDVDDADRFSLLFAQPVADPSLIGKTLDRPWFVIDPAPPGKWVWADAKRLDYILEKRLPPGRTWTLRPAANLELLTGRVLKGDAKFTFETSRLRVDDVRLLSMDGSQAILEAQFNQPVDPNDLVRLAEIRDPNVGSISTPVAMTHGPSDKIQLRVARPRGGSLNISIDERLAGVGGERGLFNRYRKTLNVPVDFRVTGAGVNDNGIGSKASVYIQFSRELDRKQNLPEVRIEPPVAGVRVEQSYANLLLTGPFQPGARYTATVGPEVLAKGGDSLGKPQSVTFDIPLPSPQLSFPLKKGILSTRGNLLLDVDAVNVGGLNLSATRVYPNNLVAALQNLSTAYTSHSALAKTFPLDMPTNVSKRFALDLNGLFEAPRGIYTIYASATDRNWTSDQATVSITDIGLTAKRYPTGVMVWATSIASGKPIEGVKISLLSYSNQTLATALTGAEGIARLEADPAAQGPAKTPIEFASADFRGEEGYEGFRADYDGENDSFRYKLDFPSQRRPWVIIAEMGDDQAYLQPDRRQWVIDDIDQSGREYPETYDVFLYTERGVYRPGDTVHVTGIVRDAFARTPEPFPLSVTVTRPDGKSVAEIAVKPDAQGVFHADYPTSVDARTGSWGFSAALPGAKEPLGATSANLEAFLPVRIEIKAKSVQEVFGAGQSPAVTIDARYLFGQTAAGLPLTIAGEYKRAAFTSQKFKDYIFGGGTVGGAPLAKIEQNLDDAGHADATIPPPPNDQRGYWLGKFSATVTEVGGRSVSTNFKFNADTADRHIGLRLNAGKMIEPKKNVTVDWVQRTGRDESAPSGPMEMSLVRVVYDSRVEQVNGQPTWKSETVEIPVFKKQIEPAAGAPPEGAEEFSAPQSGEYRLRFVDSQTGNLTEVSFYASYGREYGDEEGNGQDGVPMNKPERVEVVLDKAIYQPGDTAKVLLRSPVPGTVLMSIETDRVVDQRIFEMAGNTMSVDVPIHQNLIYGAYVAVSVVRAVDKDASEWLPHRAVGMARLKVNPKTRALPVQIEAPEKAFPQSKITLTVRTAPPIDPERPGLVHLWAVDEGILMTTAFKTPDPVAHFYAPRKSVVASSDIFSDLMPDTKRAADITRIGGDGDGDGLYRNPVAAKRREPAVIWRASAPVDADGSLTVDLDLPDFTGELRFMAIAVDHDHFGAGEQKVTVSAPLMIETTWPRFSAPNDQFGVPIKIFNTTDKPAQAILGMTLDGPIQIDTPLDPLGYTVQPGEPKTVWLSVRAAADLGLANVKITGTAEVSEGAVTARSEASFPVRPAGSILSQAKFSRFAAGESFVFDPPSDLYPDSVKGTLTVSGKPAVELLPAVEALIDYPYGCIEQTTSRLLGMLYAPDLLALEKPEDARRAAAADFIKAGIGRLWSMQTPSGGLGYWPGDTQPNVWGTGYGVNFLLQAKRAGYEIPPRFQSELLAWMESQLRVRSQPADLDDNTRALFCRALAGFEKPNQGWMATLTERVATLDMAARAHLASAWLETGRKDQAIAVLKDDTIAQSIAPTGGGRLTSQVAQEAALLDTLLDLDKGHAWIPILVDRLMKARRSQGYWGNTVENAAALAALARYQALNSEPSDFTGTLMMGSLQREFGSAAPLGLKLLRFSDPINLATQGKGNVYATLSYKGLGRDATIPAYDKLIEVRRTWTDALGKPVDPLALRVGDLVNVEVAIRTPATAGNRGWGPRVENVAIVDLIPAGLEVENPRLDTSADAAAAGGATPDRVEFLDDRVLLFTSVDSNKRVFRYPLRAVTAGTFAGPPIQADSMYDTAYASLSGGGTVKIAERN